MIGRKYRNTNTLRPGVTDIAQIFAQMWAAPGAVSRGKERATGGHG